MREILFARVGRKPHSGLEMIQHTVAFSLKHPTGSGEETDFLKATLHLANLPGVQNFQCLRQIGKKNPYTFGLSMEFESEADYKTYNSHPEHVDFVRQRWIPEVADFVELDYTAWCGD